MGDLREPLPDFATLDDDQILAAGDALDALLSHPSWPTWQQMVDSFRRGALEEMANREELRDIHFFRGAVWAAKILLARPAQIIDRVAEIRAVEEQERKTAAAAGGKFLTRVLTAEDLDA
jgi:hypothetical protein